MTKESFGPPTSGAGNTLFGNWLFSGLSRKASVDRSVAGVLLGLVEIRPRAAIALNDALAQQVPDLLARGRHVGGKDVIEAAILADDDDEVFDRRAGLAARRSLPGIGYRRTCRELEHRQRTEGDAHGFKRGHPQLVAFHTTFSPS